MLRGIIDIMGGTSVIPIMGGLLQLQAWEGGESKYVLALPPTTLSGTTITLDIVI